MIEYQILRSCRKTLALQVKQGHVFVRAPYHVDEKCISSFIQKKNAWLKAKISEQSQTVDYCCNFTHGSKLFLFGQLVTLNIVFANPGEKSSTSLQELVSGHPELSVVLSTRIHKKKNDKFQLAAVVKKHVEHYFMQQAQKLILPKVEYYSKLTQLASTSVKIRQYRARWGSCNNRGELSFNYLLMMLPERVIDYVVVHELCHLRYLNHSTHFWQLVAKFFPDYAEAKKWIKTNQSALLWRLPVT